MNDNDKPQNQPQRPVETLRDGKIKASIWRNKGENGDYFSATFARTYTDQDENPRDTNSFIGADLLRLSELTRQTYNRTNDLRREAFKEQRRKQSKGQNKGKDIDH